MKKYAGQRRFGYKYTWTRVLITNSKTIAQNRAKKTRAEGNLARVVRTARGYDVYIKTKGTL